MINLWDSPEWDQKRVDLQDQLKDAAEQLLDHMGPSGMRGIFEFEGDDGRQVTVTVEAEGRPKGH